MMDADRMPNLPELAAQVAALRASVRSLERDIEQHQRLIRQLQDDVRRK